ncbi:MAG TPA: GNAT family N-acetyltransferase [Candidatus Cybelea sp.]|nr:GNAT family N-acetyltransferase [Candidatus Cybelea sp.]
MAELLNLAIELDRDFPVDAPFGIEIGAPGNPDERTLAWIDQTFGGCWSSEANAGSTIVARRDGNPVGFAAFNSKGLRFAWLDGLAREPGIGIFGPFGVAPAERNRGLGRALLRLALNALRERGFTRALIPAVTGETLVHYYAKSAGARIAERFEAGALFRPSRRTLVMASGNGSNFQAVLEGSRSGMLPIEIVALLGSDERAYAVERARNARVESVRVVSWNRAEEERKAYDARLLEAAKSERPDLVLLLGWMHLLSDSFVGTFPQILNLHPAFLPLDPRRDEVVMPDGNSIPAFRGARAIRDALALSSEWVGATLHRVTAATDRGPVLARRPLRVEPKEDETHLMNRVHELERGVVRAGVTRWAHER